MTDFAWPDPQGLLDDLEEYFAEEGATLHIARREDFIAGLERARSAHHYDPQASVHHLAALIFDRVSTRHPLLDGDKRLAWQSAVVFLGLNGQYLDAPEVAAFEIGMAVIKRERPVEDLAVFFAEYCIEDG